MTSRLGSSEDIDVDIEGEEEEFVTILSIDGGGMRGVIPAVILRELESCLQVEAQDNDARIAEYFDYIAGTSTGGIVTALLTVPTEGLHHAAEEIIGFYREEGKNIFDTTKQFKNEISKNEVKVSISDKSEAKRAGPSDEKKLTQLINWAWGKASQYTKATVRKVVWDPKYDIKVLHAAVARSVGEKTMLADIKSNVIMTAFDLKKQRLKVFSSQHPESKMLRLADVVTATTAAPYYFAPHKFQAADGTKYNFIDGGVAANNPVLVAVVEAMKNWKTEEKKKTKKKFLILSIGTGSEEPKDYNITDGGLVDWFFKPIVDTLMRASYGMVEAYTPLLEAYCNIEQDFLRIQEPALGSRYAAMDNAAPQDIDNLEKIANNLLAAKAVYMTAENEEPKERGTTNSYELEMFAKKLVEERKRRTNSGKK